MNLIMTLGASYQYSHLKPIFNSLASTGYAGDFIFFHNDLSKATLNKLKKYDFELIPFEYSYPYVKNTELINNLTEEPTFTPHPKTLRYLLYNAFLKANENKYQNVLIVDCRDLIFQKDPFSDFTPTGLHCFEEDRIELIGNNHFNSLWIRDAFGADTLELLASKPILCSGTSYGTISTMIHYTELMIKTIKKVKDQGCKDQGIHNYLIHTGQVENVHFHADDTGPVSTISSFKGISNIKLSESNLVMGKDGSIVNVVHQYDRYWKLLWKYDKRGFIITKWNFIKQFLLAVKKSRRLKFSHLKNLKSILFNPMVQKFDWDS